MPPQVAYEVGIVRQFTFTSSLQRMSVIARILGASHMNAYVKGAPEKIASLCQLNTSKLGRCQMLSDFLEISEINRVHRLNDNRAISRPHCCFHMPNLVLYFSLTLNKIIIMRISLSVFYDYNCITPSLSIICQPGRSHHVSLVPSLLS